MDIFNEARRRLRLFCANNGFQANEEILNCPMKNNEEFFVGRDISGWNLSPEELARDMGESEAIIILDDITGNPVIIYDRKKFAQMDEEDKIQILIHEMLHYREAENPFFAGIPDEDEDEAEAEILSFIVSLGYDKSFEEARKYLKKIGVIQPLSASYFNKRAGKAMRQKIETVTVKELKKRII